MNDLIITICRDTRKVKLNRGFIGLNGENLQGNIIVDFTDIADFVDGTAYLEVNQKGEKYFIEMQKNAADKTYSLPIKSSLLRYSGNTPYQVKIEQTETENGVPVFKSEVFQVPCLEAINATETIPEQYPTRFVTKEELAENLANGEYPEVKTETLSVSAGEYKSKIVQHENTAKDITVKLPTEDGTIATEEKYKWKLLMETEITQEMIDEAGEEGITAIVMDLGKPIKQWYGETWLRFECGSTKDLNSIEKVTMVFKFGSAVVHALNEDTSAACNVFHGNGACCLLRDYSNGVSLFTNWYDNLAYGTTAQIKVNSSTFRASNAYASSGGVGYTSEITGMRYVGFYGQLKAFKFPAGTKLKLYGRF